MSACVVPESAVEFTVAASRALLDRALDWIDAHLDEFDPLWMPGQFDCTRGQRLGELAILARTVSAMADRSGDPRIQRMVALLVRSQTSAVYRDRLLRAPTELMLFLEIYTTLRALGVDDALIRGRLQKATSAAWLHQSERFPHREMDIRSCLDACGLECDSPPLDELYRRSLLGTPPNPILLNEHDLYALTHVVMFVCDFGARPPDAMPHAHVERVTAILSALAVVAARDRHWDLLAEFLLCWSCLERPETGVIEMAWDALARAQRADGSVPGPEARLEPRNDTLAFDQTYHTTLVCALAASVRLGKTTRPTDHRRDRDGDRRTGRAEPVLDERYDRHQQELRDVAARAAAWLRHVIEAECGRDASSPSRLTHGLVGLWCCSALADEAPPAADASRIVRRLSDPASASGWQAMPPLLKCVSAAWTAACGLVVPSMHGEPGFLHRARLTLQRASAASEPEGLDLGEIWTALHHLGMAPVPPAISAAQLADRARGVSLDSEPGQVDALLLLVETATASGTRAAPLTADAMWIPPLVAGLAVDACRRYDLARAADLVRLGVSIAGDDPCARQLLQCCADFLIFSQREDGAFGFLETALATRRQERGPDADDSDCLLPLTVSCLLALTEYFRDWRLLSALGSLAPAVQAAAMES